MIAVLGAFSSYITESIKFALNRANLRVKQYEELAADLSAYIFWAELNTEFIEHDWTTKPTMSELVKGYNDSLVMVRKKEFVYLSWIRKYWGQTEADQFESVMASVREFDLAIHALNDEFEAVNLAGTKARVDRKLAEDALKRMKPALENMRSQGRQFLMARI